jgi:hypothetical protein
MIQPQVTAKRAYARPLLRTNALHGVQSKMLYLLHVDQDAPSSTDRFNGNICRRELPVPLLDVSPASLAPSIEHFV